MKSWPVLLLAACATGAPLVAEQSAIPTPFPPERYAAMLINSPFALATPVAAPPPTPERGFAADWYVTGLGRVEDTDFVSIKSRDLATSFSLFGTEESNGVALVGVEWSNERGKSTVTVKKGGEIARLEFNQADVQGANAAPPPMPGQIQQPGQVLQPGRAPGQMQPVVRPLGSVQPQTPMQIPGQAPRAPIPRPTGLPVITQPGVGQPIGGQPFAQPGGADPAPSENRRRIRVIGPK